MYVIPLLAIGGIGGTIYHAFRYSEIFLLMDWVPILIICLSAGFYFLMKSLESWKPAVLITAGIFLLERMVFEVFSPRIAINASYIVLASFVLFPTWLMLHKQHYFQGKYVVYALLAFITAIFFRIADRWEWLPMGTHFLWHTFGAVACHLMLWYFYTINAVDEGKVTIFANNEVTEEEKLKAS
jgi:hemolysin III